MGRSTVNSCLSEEQKALGSLTPYEAWSGTKPSVDHLKVFGCAAYAHISKEERQKLDLKAKKCILLGYGTDVKGYRLYNLQERRVFYSRDVVFDENNCSGLEKEQLVEDKVDKLVEINLPDNDNTEEMVIDNQEREESSENETVLRRSSQERRRINTAQEEHCSEPITFEEVMTSPEKERWIEAMNKEMASIKANDVYDLVELPKDRKAVGSK